MNNEIIINKNNSELVFDIKKGQIKEFYRDGEKIFHSFSNVLEGEWGNSHITIFPIAGKKDIIGNNFKLGGHGLIRYLIENGLFEIEKLNNGIRIKINYKPKDNLTAKGKKIYWTNSFNYSEDIILDDSGNLEFIIKIKNNSNSDMFYNLGTHPAFKSFGEIKDNNFEIIFDEGKIEKYNLLDIINSEGNFKVFKNIKSINFTGNEIKYSLYSEQMTSAQIWAPTKTMFAIENMIQNEIEQNLKTLPILKFGKEKTYITKLTFN